MNTAIQPTEKVDYCVDCGTAPCFHPFSPALVAAMEDAEERADRLEMAVERWRFMAVLLAVVVVLLVIGMLA